MNTNASPHSGFWILASTPCTLARMGKQQTSKRLGKETTAAPITGAFLTLPYPHLCYETGRQIFAVAVLLIFCVCPFGCATPTTTTLQMVREKSSNRVIVSLPQFNLGLMYENGVDVPKDPQEAVKWFHKAADQGYATGRI